jgi:hypothetical protein
MKTITIKNLSIQIDADGSASPLEQALKAIDLINSTLHEIGGLGAQIFCSGLDESDVKISDVEEE